MLICTFRLTAPMSSVASSFWLPAKRSYATRSGSSSRINTGNMLHTTIAQKPPTRPTDLLIEAAYHQVTRRWRAHLHPPRPPDRMLRSPYESACSLTVSLRLNGPEGALVPGIGEVAPRTTVKDSSGL
ncbi:hypothetical protein FIBSPDRAFT_1036037 [Athelia psychrophila]|uniref:Uncharacterized protein n=1 Tax=Athelia psychrophila TaxID=1759441 RepID=A0A166W891_9AGAM|nr:hypothetical protein FIBSPDRAFT_1036037 [Fibularhizoctonia sp. CBS 109695]